MTRKKTWSIYRSGETYTDWHTAQSMSQWNSKLSGQPYLSPPR